MRTEFVVEALTLFSGGIRGRFAGGSGRVRSAPPDGACQVEHWEVFPT